MDYKAPDFGVRPTYIASSAGIESAQFRSGGETSVNTGRSDSSAIESALAGLVGQYANVADKMIQTSEQHRYLAGASKVGMIQAEEEIKGNPLTRDWEVAGYRDAQNRELLADSETQLAADMAELRTKPPEQFQQYLQDRRNQLVPMFNSGSAEANANMMTRLLASDNAAIKEHATQYQTYVQGRKQSSMFKDYTVASMQLTEARKLAEADPTSMEANQGFKAQLLKMTGMIGDMLTDQSLTAESKSGLLKEMLEDTMRTGNLAVYDALRRPMVDGEDSLISMLPIKDQQALSEKFVAAQEKYNLNTTLDIRKQFSQIKASMEDFTYPFEHDEIGLEKMISKGVSAGVLKAGDVDQMWKDHYDYINKKRGSADMVGFLRNGDTTSILNTVTKNGAAGSLDDAWRQWETYHAMNKSSIQDRAHDLLGIGKSGITDAYTRLGKLAGPLFAQLSDPVTGKANLPNQQLFLEVTTQMDALEQPGAQNNPYAVQAIYEGMPQDQAMQMRRIRALMKQMPLQQAIDKAAEVKLQEEKLGPNKAAAAAAYFQDDAKALKELTTMSNWQNFKSMFTDPLKHDLMPAVDVFWENPTDEAAHKNMAGQMRSLINDEVTDIRLTAPSMSSEDVVHQAMVNVHARSVTNKWGTFVVPKGQTLQSFFGVSNDYGRDSIGKAIEKIIPEPRNDYKWGFSTADGKLNIFEYGPDGKPLSSREINPKVVATKLQELDAERITREKSVSSMQGTQVTDKNGSTILAYNGMNTAGVRADWMKEFRSTLVKNEGAYEGTKKDSLGIETWGGGLRADGMFAPKPNPVTGKVGAKELSTAFYDATDAVAIRAVNLGEDYNLKGKSAFMLMAELGHQSGPWFSTEIPSYKPVLNALQAGNADAAKEAFKATPAYKVSGEDRRNHYLQLIDQTVKGM